MKLNCKLGRFVPLFVVVSCMLYGFAGMFFRIACKFNDKMEDMSFGWYVPVFSLYVLWTQRKELVNTVSRPSWCGFLACIPFCLIALLGSRGMQVRFEQIGFIGLCITVPWAFFGRRFAKCFFFPAVYLLFTIPLSTFLDAVTIHLRLLASSTALAILHGFGVDAVQQGTAIVSTGSHPFSIDVAEPCSGLRSLFALMALTAAFAWFNLPTWGRRFVLFACSVPLAVLGNVLRIISICVIAASTDAEFALGFYHDYSGYIVFIVAISAMLGINKLLLRGVKKTEKEEEKGDVSPSAEKDCGRAFSPVIAVTTLVLSCVFVFQGFAPAPIVAEAPEVVLPASIAGFKTDDILFCHNDQCGASCLASNIAKGSAVCPVCGGGLHKKSLGEATVLPEDTVIIKKNYEDFSSGFRYAVSVVVGGADKRSIHRPELCLPAQGFRMVNPIDIEVNGRPFRVIQVDRIKGTSSLMAYTFFNQNDVVTSSHMHRIFMDTWDRSVFNRIDRWVMVTVRMTDSYSAQGVKTSDGSDVEVLKRFLEKLFATGLKGVKDE